MSMGCSARVVVALVVCLAAFLLCGGCLGAFAENQARRQAARSADKYVRKYVEPELGENREARNALADTIVRAGNPRQQGQVGVDDRGWLTKENR